MPVNNTEILGADSGDSEPDIYQIFIEKPVSCKTEIEFERKLYVFRQYVSNLLNETIRGLENKFYFASMSCRTIIYKGMLTTMQVPGYFIDLFQDNFTSALAIVHSRFSTNTFPEWKLAQPFRFIAHNGEINTVKGNSSWMQAQSALFSSQYFSQEELDMILPICNLGQSDSAILDNAIEMLYLSGRSLPHVMMMLIPEAWDGNESMESYKKDFNGEVVITKRNQETLEAIANATDGQYQDGNDTQAVLDFVSEQLKAMDKKEFEAKKFVSYKDRFQPFLIAALLFLIIDLFLFETKTKWVQKLNLFNENER